MGLRSGDDSRRCSGLNAAVQTRRARYTVIGASQEKMVHKRGERAVAHDGREEPVHGAGQGDMVHKRLYKGMSAR